MKIELLFELFCDNIPARMQKNAAQQLCERISQQFSDFEITELQTFVTTFRFGFFLQGFQKIEKRIKGPKCNAPKQAISGFAKKHKFSTKNLLINEEKGVKTFYIVQKIDTIINSNITQILQNFSWPITMYWNESNQYWIRPIRNVLCIFNSEILPIEFANLQSTNCTFDRNENPISITDFLDYQVKMQKNEVFIDKNEHCNNITKQIKKIAPNFEIPADFFGEIVGLSEHTYCFAMDFSLEKFQELPMFAVEKFFLQQKCIFLSDQGQVIIFANTKTENDGENIKNGYKIMLESKLEDLMFFYNHDRAKSLDIFLAKLDNYIFHKDLGSLTKKSQCVAKIAKYIIDKNFVDLIIPNDYNLEKIVLLCKADLTSAVVNEMHEMRGVIGAHYWKKLGVSEKICNVVKNHYELSESATTLSLIINLADHLETVFGFFAIGEIPTGSKDPLGIKNHLDHTIIYSVKLKIDLQTHVDYAINFFAQDLQFDAAKLKNIFHELIIERFIFNYFVDEKRDLILAILYHHIDCNFSEMLKNARAILRQKSQITALLPIYKRIKNILKNEEQHSKQKFNFIDKNHFIDISNNYLKEIKADFLCNEQEKNLFSFLNKDLIKLSKSDLFKKLYQNKKLINDFFDNCLINSENLIEKNNRYFLVRVLKCHFVAILNFELL